MKIWARLGVMLDVPEEQAQRILNGDKTALLMTMYTTEELNNVGWYLEGESYIPVEGNENLNLEDDIEFEI